MPTCAFPGLCCQCPIPQQATADSPPQKTLKHSQIWLSLLRGHNDIDTYQIKYICARVKQFRTKKQSFKRGMCERGTSQVAIVVKPPASAGGVRVAGLLPCREDPLEEGVAMHSSVLTWRIPGQRSLTDCSP